MKILIVEDEKELLNNMVRYLQSENFLCEKAEDYKTALDKIDGYDYDCVLLDVNLPDGNGLSLLEDLKKNGKTDGVIIISARDSLTDRIRGLNLGADDYLIKPFHLSELNARVSAVIRRRRFNGQNIIVINDITLDLLAKVIFIRDRPVELTRKEYDLLLFLVTNKNRVISKNAIAEHLSGSQIDYVDSFDFIYTHIKNLKRKLAQAGGGDYIKSLYGSGYKYEVRS
ncbi:MAG: response regulator transcription factor [Bacteroidota bacterium]|nr:response regulator transcription factor [Bacteroidota bacterium]